jgi:8-oxo-dGTP diphosphatase
VTSTPRPEPAVPLSAVDGPQIVVGAAIIRHGRVLAAQRATPPAAAGRREFPGGKVDPGETEPDALVRECVEELGVRIGVGDRLGADVPMVNGAVLRLYLAELLAGEPRALEHLEIRWLAADELDSVPWLPADAPLAAALAPHLAG